MQEFDHLAKTVGAIRSASALTEATFLRAGQTLESSIAILSELGSSFETVMNELKGDALNRALHELRAAADKVVELVHGQPQADTGFARLHSVATAIAGQISKLNQTVKAADSLVINAKIAAASIRAPGTDFSMFAIEIGTTMRATRTTLDSFASDLQGLSQSVGTAYAGRQEFEQRLNDSSRTVPERLNATVNSIPLRHRRIAEAIGTVRRRSEHVQKQVGVAILALQAGDITRQRLEHTDSGLTALIEAGRSPARHELPGGSAWTEDERRALTLVGCRLQAAQLADAAQEFERGVRQITSALNSLAEEARSLRGLAASAFGASERDQGTFIIDLEAKVGDALALFTDFGTSQAEVARVMAAVSDGAESLCERLRTVQSLEADIRIIGLNTTLKCARLGPEGRALGLVAQELRAYGDAFAKEAGRLIGEVEALARVARSMGTQEADAAWLAAGVMQTMKDALATLRLVGNTLDDTLSAVERDSDRVVTLLERTAADLGSYDEIDRVMRQAAVHLQELAPPGPLGDLTPRAEELLDRISRGYTMAHEGRSTSRCSVARAARRLRPPGQRANSRTCCSDPSASSFAGRLTRA